MPATRSLPGSPSSSRRTRVASSMLEELLIRTSPGEFDSVVTRNNPVSLLRVCRNGRERAAVISTCLNLDIRKVRRGTSAGTTRESADLLHSLPRAATSSRSSQRAPTIYKRQADRTTKDSGLLPTRLSEEPSSVVVADSGTSKEQERASSVTDLDEEAAWLERVTTAEKLLADATTHPIMRQNVCAFCGGKLVGMNSVMRRLLLIQIIHRSGMHQDLSGVWRMQGCQSRRFCEGHQIFDEFGRVFEVDFDALPDRIKGMEAYFKELMRSPEQYPFFKQIQEQYLSRRRSKDLSPAVYAQTLYSHYGYYGERGFHAIHSAIGALSRYTEPEDGAMLDFATKKPRPRPRQQPSTSPTDLRPGYTACIAGLASEDFKMLVLIPAAIVRLIQDDEERRLGVKLTFDQAWEVAKITKNVGYTLYDDDEDEATLNAEYIATKLLDQEGLSLS